MNVMQTKTWNNLRATKKGLSRWTYREEPCACDYVTACAYADLGHAWLVWIIGKRGALANHGRAVLLPTLHP